MTPAVEIRPVGEQRILLEGITWDFYRTFCDQVDGRSVRLSFDNGKLEIMITKRPHEFYKTILAKLVEQMVFELNIPVASGGNMTFQREDLERGFEPDECWWIANEKKVRGRSEFDFRHDPPPDLALEVEMSSPLVNRVGIYAALGVPEIWRFNGEILRFCVLQPNGKYADAESSRAFLFLHPQDLMPILRNEQQHDETRLLKDFVAWLRSRKN